MLKKSEFSPENMEERRSSPRLELRIQMELRTNGDVFQGTSVNLSETGVLIETNKKLELGVEVRIFLTLPNQEQLEGKGTVVRKESFGFDNQGYAVHWELDPHKRRVISEWINLNLK